MKRVVQTLVLLLLAALVAMPAAAGELRVTGFIANYFLFDQNMSNTGRARDMTDNKDNAAFWQTRNRTFFNFVASDDLRGILGIELDSTWGAPARNRTGSRCITAEQCGFRNAIDINNFELKWLYVDFRIPQLPIGNRVQVGGHRPNVTPLHGSLLFDLDVAGIQAKLDFTPEVSLLLNFAQFEEDVERFRGSTKIGEDFMVAGTLMLKPLPRWDLHLVWTYGHLHAPGLDVGFQSVGPLTTNVVTEDRHYLGFDSRYRIGNLSLEPSFFYLTGSRKFCTAGGPAIPGGISDDIGGSALEDPVTCRSLAPGVKGGVRELDIGAFMGALEAHYAMGPWIWSFKFAYLSGDEATANITNDDRANATTRVEDVSGFRPLRVETPYVNNWLTVLGAGAWSSLPIQAPYRIDSGGPYLDRFGFLTLAGRAQHKVTDKLTLTGTVGAAWTAEEPACPADRRTAAPSAANPTGCSSLTTNVFNFTGDSRYLGWEIGAFSRYSIMPGLLWTAGAAYAFTGDGWKIRDLTSPAVNRSRNVQDAWVVVPMYLLYVF